MSYTAAADRRRRETTVRELARAGCSAGGERREALQRVVEANMTVADSVARRYAGRGVPEDELRQLAYLGLTYAADRFDAARKNDFLTFALPWMTGTIRRHFRDHTWAVRPQRRVQELHRELARLEGHGGLPPTVDELAARLGTTPEGVREVLRARQAQKAHRLDEAVGRGINVALAERLAADETAAMRSADARLVLQQALPALTPRERHVLRRLYVDSWTQQAIGQELGLAQMSISRIHAKALDRLRTVIGAAA